MNAFSLGLAPTDDFITRAIAFHPQAHIIAAGGTFRNAGAVKLIYLASCPLDSSDAIRPVEDEYPLSLGTVDTVAFSPSGRHLAIIGCDADVDKLFVYNFTLYKELFPDLTTTPTAYREDAMKLKSGRGSPLTLFRKFSLESSSTAIAWSPCGSFLATAGEGSVVTIHPVMTVHPCFDYQNDSTRRSITTQTIRVGAPRILGLSWSPCGTIIMAQAINAVFVIACLRKRGVGKVIFHFIRKIGVLSGTACEFPLRYGMFVTPEAYANFQKEQKHNSQNGTVQLQGTSPASASEGSVRQPDSPPPAIGDGASLEAVSNGVSLFLEKGPEKAMGKERRTLRTIYSISLYRRKCAFSPDGSFCVVPCGALQTLPDSGETTAIGMTFCAYIFDKHTLVQVDGESRPAVILPGHRYPSVDVSFSPILYQPNPNLKNYSGLPYAMYFVILAGCDAHIYTTQDFSCIASYRGDSFQTSFFTYSSWCPSGTSLCCFGCFYQYTFLTLLPSLCVPFISSTNANRIVTTIKASYILLNEKTERIRARYLKAYMNYKIRLIELQEGSSTVKPTLPPKPVLDNDFLAEVVSMGLPDDLKDVPLYALSPRLYNYRLMAPPQLTFSEAELDLSTLKQRFEKSKASSRQSPSLVMNEKEQGVTHPAEPALKEATHIVDKNDTSLTPERIAALVLQAKEQIKKERKERRLLRESRKKWQKGWYSSEEDESDSGYSSDSSE
ncbi:Transducin [Giardia muris]|uniref:Transducin n=1 Tax=Giardia muris TaxID=5742 RepID=A0A4Z1SRF5_GIAMU|nr:Transducin [Giardia muris]|eukprot:TNJ26208.1 Transducin [Giardia muris]